MTTVQYQTIDTVLHDIRHEYNYIGEEFLKNIEHFHPSSLRFIAIIVSSIMLPIRENLDNNPLALMRNFPDVLMEKINQSVAKYYGEIDIYSNAIFDGFLLFINEEATTRRLKLITPWDIIGILTDLNGDSIIPLISFPSNSISVQVILNDLNRREIFDLNIDQFMGMVAGAIIIETRGRMNSTFGVSIFDVITDITSFNDKLDSYYYLDRTQLRPYILIVPKFYQLPAKTFASDNLDFILGFVTIINLAEQDYNDYNVSVMQNGRLIQI